jgi:hypothetical protein
MRVCIKISRPQTKQVCVPPTAGTWESAVGWLLTETGVRSFNWILGDLRFCDVQWHERAILPMAGKRRSDGRFAPDTLKGRIEKRQ